MTHAPDEVSELLGAVPARPIHHRTVQRVGDQLGDGVTDPPWRSCDQNCLPASREVSRNCPQYWAPHSIQGRRAKSSKCPGNPLGKHHNIFLNLLWKDSNLSTVVPERILKGKKRYLSVCIFLIILLIMIFTWLGSIGIILLTTASAATQDVKEFERLFILMSQII